WFVGGASGRVELVGPGGNAASVSGRFVNAGAGIDLESRGKHGWLVAAADGTVQRLDASGEPQNEAGNSYDLDGKASCLEAGAKGWLLGLSSGDAQLINRDGRPTSTISSVVGGEALTAAAHASGEWMIGTAGGTFVRVGDRSLQRRSQRRRLDGRPAIVEVVRAGGKWIVFTDRGFARIRRAQIPDSATELSGRSGAAVTAATAAGGRVAVGLADGRVAVVGPGGLETPSWQDALGSKSVRDLTRSGDRWLVVGDGGRARLLEADGTPVGDGPVTLGAGNDLSGARAVSDGWLVAIASLSAVQSVDPQLESASASASFDGESIEAVAAGGETVAAVGSGGTYRLYGPDGTPATDVKRIGGVDRLHDVAWDGRHFAIVGADGAMRRIAPDGTVEGRSSHLGGTALSGVSWSGRFWLVVGRGGRVQRLRRDGSDYTDPVSFGFDRIYGANFSGREWLIYGAKGGQAAFALLSESGDVRATLTTIGKVSGALRAAAWSGRTWLAGGEGGAVVRIGQGGDVIRRQGKTKFEVLYGFTIRSASFDGEHFLIGGDNGAVRRLNPNASPAGAATAINRFEAVLGATWTEARGFAGGPCLSSDFCYDGSCVGTVSEGICCNESCSGPCVACRSSITGEPDGTCAPVPAGEEPPERKSSMGEDCLAEPKETCGKTGKCDGEGTCAVWGTDVTCRPASCRAGKATPAGHCDGKGTCSVPDPSSCSPYAGCDGDACLDSCESDAQCAEGFSCQGGECREDAGGGGGGGGCSTTGDRAPGGGLLILILILSAGGRESCRRIGGSR
ncbi:MAG: hypothetical protein ABEL76_11785, partial [Bradymonadaceae bacterium]